MMDRRRSFSGLLCPGLELELGRGAAGGCDLGNCREPAEIQAAGVGRLEQNVPELDCHRRLRRSTKEQKRQIYFWTTLCQANSLK